jgi:diguanylate cyclase (GGDEF)-like protein/PAS domain S-box-containing protein
LKTYNLYYSQNALAKLPVDKINSAKSVLVQVFSGICDVPYLEDVIQNIKQLFPKAVIIGATTDGEMMGSEISTGKVVISVTTFKKSKLRAYRVKKISKKGSFQAGRKVAKKLVSKNSKVMIAFSDGLNTNGEELLNGIASVSKSLVVSGGLAADNAAFEKTYLLDSRGVYDDAVVAVVIDSKKLHVQTDYKLNWQPIGKMLKVTYAEGNRVYSIDNKNPVEVYKHYLGDNVASELPKTGVEFPLITRDKGVNVTRAVLMRHEDDSLSFAGNMQTGAYYQFGFANIEMAQEDTKRVSDALSNEHIETIFVYSCMARRRFSQALTTQELAPLVHTAKVSGFFTYGEFFHTDKSTNLLNQSMTILALTENPYKKRVQKSYIKDVQNKGSATMSALSHLITVASSELEEMSKKTRKITNSVLVNNGPVVHWKIALKKRFEVKFVSSNITSFLGYSAEELLNRKVNFLELIAPEDKKDFFRKIKETKVEKGISFEGEFSLITKTKEKKFFHYFMALERGKDHNDVLHGYMVDITKRKISERQITFLAFHDVLTSLPNRTEMERRLNEDIENAIKNHKEGVLLFLDLNRFKQINDKLGHHVGDEVLKVTARRLQECIGNNGWVSRLGGDEFVAVLPEVDPRNEYENVKKLSEKLYARIEEPILFDNEELYVSTSIGAAVFPTDATRPDTILKLADSAMYNAKKEKSNCVKFYSIEMDESIKDGFVIETHLRKAIQQEEFTLLYQPQIDITSGLIVGAEALIRWKNSTLGTMLPDRFIPVAENTGQIVEIGEWVLQEACNKIKMLQSCEDLPDTFQKISVNISAVQFRQENFVDTVYSIIEKSGINASYLEFELTEGALIDYIEEAIEKIKILKKTGLTFSIDDFGTGFSSLAYLKKFPIDILKIDKSFVQDMDIDMDDAILTETIIQMSKNLKLGVIAEGVEKVEHLDFLKERGCQMYQGYFFSEPIDFDLFVKLLLNKEETISKTLLVKV